MYSPRLLPQRYWRTLRPGCQPTHFLSADTIKQKTLEGKLSKWRWKRVVCRHCDDIPGEPRKIKLQPPESKKSQRLQKRERSREQTRGPDRKGAGLVLNFWRPPPWRRRTWQLTVQTLGRNSHVRLLFQLLQRPRPLAPGNSSTSQAQSSCLSHKLVRMTWNVFIYTLTRSAYNSAWCTASTISAINIMVVISLTEK